MLGSCWGCPFSRSSEHMWLLTGPASLNKDESRELPVGRVQMTALGRGQSSDTGKEEAMCKGVMAS